MYITKKKNDRFKKFSTLLDPPYAHLDRFVFFFFYIIFIGLSGVIVDLSIITNFKMRILIFKKKNFGARGALLLFQSLLYLGIDVCECVLYISFSVGRIQLVAWHGL